MDFMLIYQLHFVFKKNNQEIFQACALSDYITRLKCHMEEICLLRILLDFIAPLTNILPVTIYVFMNL